MHIVFGNVLGVCVPGGHAGKLGASCLDRELFFTALGICFFVLVCVCLYKDVFYRRVPNKKPTHMTISYTYRGSLYFPKEGGQRV